MTVYYHHTWLTLFTPPPKKSEKKKDERKEGRREGRREGAVDKEERKGIFQRQQLPVATKQGSKRHFCSIHYTK